MDSRLKRAILMLIGLLAGIFTTIITTGEPEKISDFFKEKDPSLFEVTSIADGDTITVDMNGIEERVRLIGIDTPEKNHPDLAVQCFAKEAGEHLRDIIGDNKVRLEADPDNTNRDIFDRLLRFVYLPDETFVNERMVVEGYAFAFTSYSNSKIADFQALENQAREANIGLWNSCEVEVTDGRPRTNPV